MKHDLFSLRGKACLVTGGNQGIGKVVARYIADAGADVAIVDIADASQVAAEIAADCGVRAKAYVCDVTNADAVRETIARAAADFDELTLLLNNAGICIHKDALDVPADEWLKVLDVNVNGVFYVAQAFARHLTASGKTGSIVNTASMSGTIVNVPQGQASYNASKAAVKHLTKSLAVEWAGKGIRVNSISPGYIRTEMTGNVRQDWQDAWVRSIPFGRMGTPEELAGAVIYLLSEASTYTSGHDLVIDGCFTAI
ncbi:MAG: SDR family oxidoreductase [Christensenellales bacterium]|jgi:sorbose reductase